MAVAKRRAFWAALCAVMVVAFGLVGTISGAWAAKPEPWQMGFQPAASPVQEEIEHFHDILLVIITVITIFVLGLLLYVMWRFHEKRNPTPSKSPCGRPPTSSTRSACHLLDETDGPPAQLLVQIDFQSFPQLYFTDVTPEPDMTIKAIGKQWFWTYEYPDNGNFTFDSYMIADADIDPSKGQIRLLSADNHLVVPVDTTIKVLLSAADVIHAFAMPAFGVKEDAVPGRLNETWFKATKEGLYYGQCSELCGNGHGYMPIVIEVVSKDKFGEWVTQAQGTYDKVEEPTN